MAATDIVTLAECKTHLNITDSSSDTELGGFISGATAVVERYVGAVVNRAVVETFDGGVSRLSLSHLPVSSVTSVVDDGATLAAGDYVVSPDSGVLSRVAGSGLSAFLVGVQSVVVTYVAGRVASTAAVAAAYPDFRLAALIIIQHMWETQRPAAAGPFTQGSDDYDPRYSYSVPRRALELLGEPIGGIA